MRQPHKSQIVKNQMDMIRVSCFIDGFNLYHAIDDLKRNELKWLNLRSLMGEFVDQNVHELIDVYYFSAYAEWKLEPLRRHRLYVKALRHYDVHTILGNFKKDQVKCFKCGSSWKVHEEKQSDVNIAVSLIRDAFRNKYDHAYLVSGDSDLVPPIKLLREIFPEKRIKLICPPGRRHSKELAANATSLAKIQIIHLEQNQLPDRILNDAGTTIAARPDKYKNA